jgi:hypothetical protein
MVRWNLFQCPWFSIKLHKILLDDGACMHDHPWSFITIILKGGYYEITPNVSMAFKDVSDAVALVISDHQPVPERREWIEPGRILYRPAKFIHRIEVDRPALTLVITFRKIRKWGFWTPLGWIESFKYSEYEHCDTS